MGWYFRRSVNLGPFRLNASKSGLGLSFGVRGARISTGPRGTYVHVGAGGVYYRERIGAPSRPRSTVRDFKGVSGPEELITSADASAFTDASADSLLRQINSRSAKIPAWPIVVVLSLLITLAGFSLHPIAAALCIALSMPSIYLTWRLDNSRWTSSLLYELDEESESRFTALCDALSHLTRAERLWRVVARQQNFDWKRNAGASSFIRRTNVRPRIRQAPFIATNVQTWSLDVGGQKLFFFPDRIFVKQGSHYGAISYSELDIQSETTRFIEDGGVPRDAEVVGYTWRYVRRDGGPDRRFSNNRQIPIVQYGFLRLATAKGLNLHFHVSDRRLCDWFAGALRNAITPSATRRSGASARPAAQRATNSRVHAAFTTLGVTVGASYEDVKTAYHQLAKLYHPDKVAHLSRDIQDLANQRMQDLNAAVQTLRTEYFGMGAGAV